MNIKFEGGWRVCRAGRNIEVWQDENKVQSFLLWSEAILYIDRIEGKIVQPERIN